MYTDRKFKMGIELELLCSFDSLRWDENYLSCYTDVSLGADGREFVTRPDSAQVHVRELGRFLAKNKFWTSNRCAMHVHVDRSQLGEGAISCLADRIFDERRKNYYSKYVFGRLPNAFCDYKRERMYHLIYGHFCAIHAGRPQTVEIRWFSGCADIRKIKRRLEWVNALCAWAKRKATSTGRESHPFVLSYFP